MRIGHDTDTVAAITGALAGAYWGASAVPAAAWRRVLHGAGPTQEPALRARDLTRLAALTARTGHGQGQGQGQGQEWPTTPVVDYSDKGDVDVLAVHPHDPGVLLGGVGALRRLPAGVDAVVSLARLGTTEVPSPGIEPGDHVEVWLIDDEDPDKNPNLAFVLADTARAVADLRAQDRTVLVHCVQAQARTPAIATAYALLHRGVDLDRASADVTAALPGTRDNPAFTQALRHLAGPGR